MAQFSQPPGNQGGGFLQQLLSPEVAMPMAAALMGNQGNAANFGNAFGAYGQASAQMAGKNKTLDYFRQNAPEFAAMVEAGMPVNEAWGTYTKQRYAQGPKPTSGMQEYDLAREQGFDGSFLDYQTALKKAGAGSTNVTVGGGRFGTIPQGYELIDGPNGASLRAIPGGPEDTTKSDQRSAGQAAVVTQTITNAARYARDAAKNRALGGIGQGIVQYNPYSDSAEVARQVEVLKAQAKVENLQAMRAASPTGGALGSVSNEENKMLADKSGALDPSSPNFERDLDNYELTLLQVVHGPEAGRRIFEATRGEALPGVGDLQSTQTPQGGVVDYRDYFRSQ
ncbi:hypothetical protein [Aquamicrobium defluvii]|uniref:Uncharacterized protein n=1 Tax=Aquamicrobium defluvii TaxID=69279 RepID=A0A011UUY6_9HYPH|nr:hypothetical protein [Aquamicrobium defluvii]EXL09708.1 hypothetical protein BG36_20810 [Aquamicrobium defluvii]EZQ16507.1 hypothetical protein CF98_40915 [Halopseudomonas bauzanensis]